MPKAERGDSPSKAGMLCFMKACLIFLFFYYFSIMLKITFPSVVELMSTKSLLLPALPLPMTGELLLTGPAAFLPSQVA